jgi:hypothetical protein
MSSCVIRFEAKFFNVPAMSDCQGASVLHSEGRAGDAPLCARCAIDSGPTARLHDD